MRLINRLLKYLVLVYWDAPDQSNAPLVWWISFNSNLTSTVRSYDCLADCSIRTSYRWRTLAGTWSRSILGVWVLASIQGRIDQRIVDRDSHSDQRKDQSQDQCRSGNEQGRIGKASARERKDCRAVVWCRDHQGHCRARPHGELRGKVISFKRESAIVMAALEWTHQAWGSCPRLNASLPSGFPNRNRVSLWSMKGRVFDLLRFILDFLFSCPLWNWVRSFARITRTIKRFECGKTISTFHLLPQSAHMNLKASGTIWAMLNKESHPWHLVSNVHPDPWAWIWKRSWFLNISQVGKSLQT